MNCNNLYIQFIPSSSYQLIKRGRCKSLSRHLRFIYLFQVSHHRTQETKLPLGRTWVIVPHRYYCPYGLYDRTVIIGPRNRQFWSKVEISVEYYIHESKRNEITSYFVSLYCSKQVLVCLFHCLPLPWLGAIVRDLTCETRRDRWTEVERDHPGVRNCPRHYYLSSLRLSLPLSWHTFVSLRWFP